MKLTRVGRSVLDEAQGVLPRILYVKGPLALRPDHDAAGRRVMDFLA